MLSSMRGLGIWMLALACFAGATACRQVLGIEPLPGESLDAGSDRSAVDATNKADADDGDVARDAGPGFCKSLSPPPPGTEVLCSDFDESPRLFESGWCNDDSEPDPGEVNGGLLALDDMFYRSYPRSLRVSTTANVSSTSIEEGILLTTIQGSGPSVIGSLVLEFDLRVDEFDTGSSGFIDLVGMDFTVNQGLALLFEDGGLHLVVNGRLFGLSAGTDQVVVNAFPIGIWEHVGMLVSNAPSDGGPDGWTSVSCAGMVVDASVPGAFQDIGPNQLIVTIGALSAGPIGPFQANIDNVVLRWGRPFSFTPP
jgi:hypothetical protein